MIKTKPKHIIHFSIMAFKLSIHNVTYAYDLSTAPSYVNSGAPGVMQYNGIWTDEENDPEYNFDFKALIITLALFIFTYELIMYL